MNFYTAVLYTRCYLGNYYRGDEGKDSEFEIIEHSEIETFKKWVVGALVRDDHDELVLFINGVGTNTDLPDEIQHLWDDVQQLENEIRKLATSEKDRREQVQQELLAEKQRIEKIAKEEHQRQQDLLKLAQLKAKYEQGGGDS